MKVYVMRHAIAVPQGTPGFSRDADRPLTDLGRKKLEAICRGLAHLNPEWELIITSPYLRAKQTATIVAEAFERSHLITEAPLLTPGHTPKDFFSLLADMAFMKEILLVGHEPSLSQNLMAALTGAPREGIEMKKAAVACLEFTATPKAGEGQLLWLMGPGQLQRLGKKKEG